MRNAIRHTTTVRAVIGLAACALLSSCVEVGIPAGEDKPWGELNPAQGMHSSPSYKDQEAQIRFGDQAPSMRETPPETVPQGHQPYALHDDADAAALLTNPVPVSDDTLRYGQLAYKTTCVVCHGQDGSGDGYVVGEQKYPTPPSLTTQRARTLTDGELFHIITHGNGRMWSYKNQLYPLERWAAIHYVRALQRADYPEPQDQQLITER